jgi:uncharacterized OsmC-like protein
MDDIGPMTRAFIERVREDPDHRSETLTVRAELVTGTHVRADTRGFTLEYDEPPSIGGSDLGPGPAETTLAALGASLVQFYAIHSRLMGLEVTHVEVDVEGVIDLRGVFQTEPGVSSGYKQIRFHTRLVSPEDPERLRRLIEVVETTTPVLASFRNPVPVYGKTEIVSDR